MSKSIAQVSADVAWERFRDAINIRSAIKRERDTRKQGRILRKGETLLVRV